LGFKWSATTDATAVTADEAGVGADDLASDTGVSSLVELQADNKATDSTDKKATRRLDMFLKVVKVNHKILTGIPPKKSVVFFDTYKNSFMNQRHR
jgi:hypothetical protein